MNKAQRTRFADYRAIFASAAGQRVLADMKASFDTAAIFQPGEADATAFRLGQRDVYLRILHCIAQADVAGKDTEEDA